MGYEMKTETLFNNLGEDRHGNHSTTKELLEMKKSKKVNNFLDDEDEDGNFLHSARGFGRSFNEDDKDKGNSA